MKMKEYTELVKAVVDSEKPFLAIGESFFLFYLLVANVSIDSNLDSLDEMIDKYFKISAEI